MMKLVFLRSLAHEGQRRSRVIWLAALPLALSLFMALIPFTSPAFAATHTQKASYVAVATSVRSIGVIQGHHFSVVSTVVTSQGASINASSTNTISHEYDWFDTGIRIFSITMTTSWCYNFVTVTCHHTTLLGNITTAGKLEGYSFNGSYNTFNCYVAAGAPGKPPSGCSGNHEHMWQSFATPLFPAGLEIQMSIDEEENYKGQSFWQVNHAYCPGYCGSSGIS